MSAKNLIIRGGADFSGVKKELDKTQKHLTSFQKGISKTMAGIGALFGGIAIGAAIKSTIQASSELESAMLGLQSILEAQGRSFTKANRFIQEYISDGLVPLTDAVTAYKNLTARGYDDQQIQQVMSRLKDAASFGRQSAYTLGEAVRSATEGLKNENSILVDNAGVTKNVAKMWDDYARSIGKSRNKLTQQEKIQAEVNGILKETQFQVGDAAKYTKTYAGRLAVLGKVLQDIRVNIGNALKPGAGVGLEGITEQLSGIKSWTEANQATMQRWGQTITNIVKLAVSGFKLITGAIAENWGVIKFAGTALLTYAAINKGAAAATAAFKIAQMALNGQLLAQIPMLGAVRAGVLSYWLQMAAAPAATNLFTAALLRLRAALYALHTALGPIGWAILAISAAVSGGMSLWSKYSQSLQKTASLGFGDFRAAQDGIAKSTGAAADAAEDQADAIEKAGKAAKKSLAGFDEIHQLQKDMSGGANEDALDDIADVGGIGGGLPGLDMSEMLNDIEQMKPTLKGFWEWTKQGMKNLWESWTETVQNWGWVKKLTAWIVDVLEKWGAFKTRVGEIWTGIKETVVNSWEAVKTKTAAIWDSIKTGVVNVWKGLGDSAKKIWEGIENTITGVTEGIKSAVKTTWESISKFITDKWTGIKDTTAAAWDGIKNFLGQTWDGIKSIIDGTLNAIKSTISGAWEAITTTLTGAWNTIKATASNVFSSIQTTILNAFTGVKTRIGGIWDDIWSTTRTYINKIISGMNTMIRGMNKLKWNAPDWVPGIGGKSWGINIPTIPALATGTNNVPRDMMAFLHKGEAVVPEKYNPAAGAEMFNLDSLADKIAAAIKQAQPVLAGSGDIYVYIGNEQVDAYIQRANDRRNVKSNGR